MRSPVYRFVVGVVVATAAFALIHLLLPGLGTVAQLAITVAAAAVAGLGSERIEREGRVPRRRW